MLGYSKRLSLTEARAAVIAVQVVAYQVYQGHTIGLFMDRLTHMCLTLNDSF